MELGALWRLFLFFRGEKRGVERCFSLFEDTSGFRFQVSGFKFFGHAEFIISRRTRRLRRSYALRWT